MRVFHTPIHPAIKALSNHFIGVMSRKEEGIWRSCLRGLYGSYYSFGQFAAIGGKGKEVADWLTCCPTRENNVRLGPHSPRC